MSERECFYCDGAGLVYVEDGILESAWDKRRCDECDGTGFEPEEDE
jgi:hypothetical protein